MKTDIYYDDDEFITELLDEFDLYLSDFDDETEEL